MQKLSNWNLEHRDGPVIAVDVAYMGHHFGVGALTVTCNNEMTLLGLVARHCALWKKNIVVCKVPSDITTPKAGR